MGATQASKGGAAVSAQILLIAFPLQRVPLRVLVTTNCATKGRQPYEYRVYTNPA